MIPSNFFVFHCPNGYQALGILTNIVANSIFGAFWYGHLLGESWLTEVLLDKDITITRIRPGALMKGDRESKKEFEQVMKDRWPYSMNTSFISSFVCNFIRSCFIFHLFVVLDVSTLYDAALLGLYLFTIHLASFHHYVWAGRTMRLVLIDYSFELCTMLLTTTIALQVPAIIKYVI